MGAVNDHHCSTPRYFPLPDSSDRHAMKRLLAIIFARVFTQEAHAHNVTLIKEQTADHPAIILIRGMLEQKDYRENVRTFEVMATLQRKVIVFFDSPGGHLSTGLRIGRLIQQRGFDTAVEDYTSCLSSCAIAWLAGNQRFMGFNARVGFHAASVSIDNHAVNAKATDVVRDYMKTLGFDQAAVSFMTDAPPSSMAWLYFSDADRLKIQVKQFSMKQPEWAWALAAENPSTSTPPASARIGTYLTGKPIGSTPLTWEAAKEQARSQLMRVKVPDFKAAD